MKEYGYSLEQIMESYDYQVLVNCFLNLAQNEETKQKLESILYEGRVGNYIIHSDLQVKDNPRLEGIRRVSMAYLLITSPETFNAFVENDINIFHGTNANALPNILKYGMSTIEGLESMGIDVTTGEKWSRVLSKRNFISFTDILEIAEDYSTISATNAQKQLDFSVLICTNEDEIRASKTISISSDISEIGVLSSFPLESIKCICVPEERVDFVKRLVNNENISVLGLSKLEDKFFYVQDFSYLNFDAEAYQRYICYENEKRTHFNLDETRKLAQGRKASKIREIITKIGNLFNKDKENNDERRIK